MDRKIRVGGDSVRPHLGGKKTMAKRGKKYQEALKLVDRQKRYSLNGNILLIKLDKCLIVCYNGYIRDTNFFKG